MRARVEGVVGLMIFVVVAMCLVAGVAGADLSAYCRNLALVFGSSPATLDVQSLAALSTCVTDEIQARAATPGPQSGDSSSGGQSSEQDTGAWPTPPAWKDKSIESKPWDSYDK